jgi:hypothetical protein
MGLAHNKSNRFYSLRDHSSDDVGADALIGEVSVRYVYHPLERLDWCTSFLFMGSSLFDNWYPSLRRQVTDSGLHDGLMANGCLPVRSSIKVHDLSGLVPLMALLNLVDASFAPELASSFFFSGFPIRDDGELLNNGSNGRRRRRRG